MQSHAKSFITATDYYRSVRAAGTIFFLLVFLLLADIASAQFSGAGSGTAGDPYVITTAAQLNEARNDLAAHYRLEANIDLSGYLDWTPIGGVGSSFEGVFDGNGHTITNLTITGAANNVGLFGSVIEAVIKNIGLIDANVEGTSNIGGLVGYFHISTIENAYVTGSVTGDDSVGGLAGYMGGSNTEPTTIRNSYAAVTVNGTSDAGGLAGLRQGLTSVEDSYYNSDLTTGSDGGIARTTAQMKQKSTFSGWDFSGTGDWGIIEGDTYPMHRTTFDQIALEDLTVENGADPVTLDPTFTSVQLSYTGRVRADVTSVTVTATPGDAGSTASGDGNVALNSGVNTATITVSSTGVVLPGTTADPFEVEYTLEIIREDGSATYPHGIRTAGHLAAIGGSSSFGLGDHYILMNDLDLSGYGNWDPIGDDTNVFSGHLDGQDHTIQNLHIENTSSPIPTQYTGLFARSSGTIQNIMLTSVSIEGDYNVGALAGQIDDGGTVNNVLVSGTVTGINSTGGLAGANLGTIEASSADVEISGSNDMVGGLVGQLGSSGSPGAIIESYATGNVRGNYAAGGLVGQFESGNVIKSYATGNVSGDLTAGGLVGEIVDGTVSESFATGSVSSSYNVGGLVGINGGSVVQSYAVGGVTATQPQVGGLIGTNDGTVNESYSVGFVTGNEVKGDRGGFIGKNNAPAGAVTASFWDTIASGYTTSAGGTGKTTSEMTDRAIYDAAGWDSAVWDWVDGRYPKLQAIAYDDSFDMAAPSAPAANIPGGLYSTDQTVSLTGESGATLYYTLDGSTPTTASTEYNSPITISNTQTLKAIAVDAAGNVSEVRTETYTIDKVPPSPPAANILGGTYNSDQTITLSGETGATIYYTLDGSTPTTASTSYSAAFTISATTTLKAIAVDAAGNTSAVLTESYTIDEAAPAVTGINDGDVVIGEVVITFSEGTATLNGSPFTSGSTVSTEGDYTLIITDAAGNKTTINFTILPENRQPTITSTPVQLVRMEQSYSYTVEAEDPDTDNSISFTAALSGGNALPSWLRFTDNGDNTATFSGTPEEADIGNYEIAVVAADDGTPQKESTQEFTLQVKYREVTELKALYNYPNPFRNTTKIKFELPEEDEVYLQIYNTTGALIRETAPRVFQAGANEYDFHAYNLSSGMYIYRIVSSNDAVTGRLVLTR